MRKLLAPVAALGLVLAMVGTVLAWVQPTLTSECAPDADHYAWKINLAEGEDNYNIDWSFDSGFATFTTETTFHAGDNSFTTPRGGTILYVRWSSDPASTAQADANIEVCAQAQSASPTQSASQTQSASGQQSLLAATGTPAATIPDASVNGIGSNPLPAIAFSMMLVASLAALAYVNLKSVGIRSGR